MVGVREHLVYVRIVFADPVVDETEDGLCIAKSGSYWQRDTNIDARRACHKSILCTADLVEA